MKFLIAGLGNPEPKYLGNRHNIGFMVLDHLAAEKEVLFEGTRYGHCATIRHRGRQLIVLKPGTFMNLSGKAVRYHLNQEKIPLERLLVVTDDISLAFGKLRMKTKGSSGGHNGLQNIIDLLGTKEYARLRFGVGNDFPKGGQVDYVLSDFSPQEKEKLPEYVSKAGDMILSFAGNGPERTMNRFND